MPDLTTETLIVRDRDSVRRLDGADDWTATMLLGALSADPRSFDELARAWLRYSPEELLTDLLWRDADEEPVSGPCLVIDLACLRITTCGGAELPENKGSYRCDDIDEDDTARYSGPLVWINFPPDWQFHQADDWRTALPALPAPVEPLDARAVLFGRPLADDIARRALEIAHQEDLPKLYVSLRTLDWDTPNRKTLQEYATRWKALTKRVHADWLMTPREDLGGETPRHFLHHQRDWVELEMHYRQLQWSHQRTAPRALDRDTFAYRYGPLGLHEVVMYFDLCREIIDASWDWIAKTPEIDHLTLSVFVYELIQVWLEQAEIEDEPASPGEIIESERRRIPLAGDGVHIDCDCPLCRMEGKGQFGLMFRNFDGYHLDMDNEFAFSLHSSRDDWEQEMEQNQEDAFAIFDRLSEDGWDTDPVDADADAEAEAEAEDPFASAWTQSYVDEEAVRAAGPSSPLAMMALALRVAELVDNLKTSGAGRELIDALNQAFDNLQAADPTAAVQATRQLRTTLEQIAAAQPGLTSKAADLQSQLDERLRNSDFPH